MSDDEFDLARAYRLKTPEDSRALYRDWAADYDHAFAAAYGYVYPDLIARIFAERALRDDQPVLDIGAGTGLVGERLAARGPVQMTGLDISPEMLAVSMDKGCYSDVIEGDLTGQLPLKSGSYGGLISAGTFTHGHVGPDAIDELLRVARPGALFVLGINAAHFEARGFGAKFQRIADDIRDLSFLREAIYADGSANDEADRMALVAVFRKAGG